jgi:hypothetical protein
MCYRGAEKAAAELVAERSSDKPYQEKDSQRDQGGQYLGVG